MAIGTCRREGCENPRRVRRGAVEPLCEDCYRQALRRVATQLSGEEAPGAARKRFQRTPAKANKQKRGLRSFVWKRSDLKPVRVQALLPFRRLLRVAQAPSAQTAGRGPASRRPLDRVRGGR